jgi:hypothetical protein
MLAESNGIENKEILSNSLGKNKTGERVEGIVVFSVLPSLPLALLSFI